MKQLLPYLACAVLVACSSTGSSKDDMANGSEQSKEAQVVTGGNIDKLQKVKELVPCRPDPDDLKQISLSGDMPDISEEKCECIHAAMVKDMARPEFKEEVGKAKGALSRMLGLEGEALETLDMQRMLLLGPLGNMETRLYKENAPNANAGLTAAINVPTTTVKAVCGFSYNDFGDMSPY